MNILYKELISDKSAQMIARVPDCKSEKYLINRGDLLSRSKILIPLAYIQKYGDPGWSNQKLGFSALPFWHQILYHDIYTLSWNILPEFVNNSIAEPKCFSLFGLAGWQHFQNISRCILRLLLLR